MIRPATRGGIRPVGHVGAMAPYALADPVEKGTVSLAQNESAFAPSPLAIEAARKAATDLLPYPDPDWTELRDVIAGVHHLDPKAILCGAGSMELIASLVRAYAGPHEEVLGSEYGYLFMASACAQVGARYVTAPETGYRVCAGALLDAVTSRTRMVFVCNPGNPTGTLIANSEMVRLRNGLRDDILLIVDQAYGEFADGAEDGFEIMQLAQGSATVVTRTFSKAYALAGARVGWGMFPKPVLLEARKTLNPNNISQISQAAAAAAMGDQAHMKSVVARTAAIRDRFSGRCRKMGFAVPDSHTNFVLIPFAHADAAARADRMLRENGLLLRGMRGYGLAHCLRATIAEAPVMDRVASVLERISDET